MHQYKCWKETYFKHSLTSLIETRSFAGSLKLILMYNSTILVVLIGLWNDWWPSICFSNKFAIKEVSSCFELKSYRLKLWLLASNWHRFLTSNFAKLRWERELATFNRTYKNWLEDKKMQLTLFCLKVTVLMTLRLDICNFNWQLSCVEIWIMMI